MRTRTLRMVGMINTISTVNTSSTVNALNDLRFHCNIRSLKAPARLTKR